jgi:putative membrane protein
LAGLLAATLLIGWFGFFRVARAASSVGPAGFAMMCAWQMVLFAGLGLAWYVLLPASPTWRAGLLVWGRMVRDAAGGCLPFSLVGGFVLGARAITLHGIIWPDAIATTVVDLSAEFLAQIAFILAGVIILAVRAPGAPIILPIFLGLAAALLSGAAFITLQRRGNAPLIALSRRILGGWSDDAATHMTAVQSRLDAIYRAPLRVAAATVLHLTCWVGTGFASWLAFYLLGAHLDFLGALGIEALLHAVLAMAILVPGYAGVQEAAYAGIGALFGQPPEIALGVSLLRRARDVALGIPILLVWQYTEWRQRQARKSLLF